MTLEAQRVDEVLRISVREARMTLDRIFLRAGVPEGLVPSVRECALISAALGLGGFAMVPDAAAEMAATATAFPVIVEETERATVVDAHQSHGWLVASPVVDVAVDLAEQRQRALVEVRHVHQPRELHVIGALARRHGATAAVSMRRRRGEDASMGTCDAADDLVVEIQMTAGVVPTILADWDPVLHRALVSGIATPARQWWELHALAQRALSPDTVLSRRHAGPTIVTADGRIIGRPVDDDTDFSLLKQGTG